MNAALLRGLPYRSSNQLYHLWERTPQKEFNKREFSYPDYQDYQQNSVFDGSRCLYRRRRAILSGNGEPESVPAVRASANFFSVLGVDPVYRQNFSSWRRQAGRAEGHRSHLRFLATKVWWRPRSCRTRANDQWRELHGDWSVAGVVSVCTETVRSLVALSTHTKSIVAPILARHQLDRTTQVRCVRCSSTIRVERDSQSD